MPTITNAPNGQKSSVVGTEKVPVSGDFYVLISQILSYISSNVVQPPSTTALSDFQAGDGSGNWIKKTLAETLTILGKASASGLASLDANTLVVEAIQRLRAATSALTTTEGYLQWDSTRKLINLYDGQRERGLTPVGWLPYAFPDGVASVTGAFAASRTLAANGGSIAVPIRLTAPMVLESVSILSNDTATQRTWGWDIYEQYLNNGNSGENTVTRAVACSANQTFTPSAASIRTLAASADTFLAPGLYWLVVQNRHASNNFALGITTGGAFATNTCQTKTTTNPNGATLDLVAATWTKQTDAVAVRLDGVVFGQTAAF